MLQYLKQLINGKESVRLIVCIGLAALFWLLTKLSQSYTSDVEIKVGFTGVPEGKVLVNPLPNKLGLTVDATGWQLLRYGIQFSKPTILLDIPDRLVSNYYPANHREEIIDQLPFAWNILQIRPAEIRVDLQNETVAERPVKLITNLSIDPQFGLIDSIRYTPTTVTVKGPSSLVDTIQSVRTKMIRHQGVTESIEGKIPLDTPPTGSVTFAPTEISYALNVESFTETKTEVSIALPSTHELDVVLLQKKTELHLQLPVSRFDQIQPSDFRVMADFNEVAEADSTVPLRVISSPGYVRNITLHPKRVKFLFLKND